MLRLVIARFRFPVGFQVEQLRPKEGCGVDKKKSPQTFPAANMNYN